MISLNVFQVLVVLLSISFTTCNICEDRCSDMNLELQLKVVKLEHEIQKLRKQNQNLLQERENCTGLVDQTYYITESLKTIQSDVEPMKTYFKEKYQSKVGDEHKIIEAVKKENELVNLTAVASELSYMSQSFQTFLEKFQTFNIEINEKLSQKQSKPSNLSSSFKQIGKKYYFIEDKEKLSWYAAAMKCRKLGGHLLNIESSEEFDLLKDYLPEHDYWTAGNDLYESNEYFSIATGQRMPYTRWHSGEPNHAADTERCVELKSKYNTFKMNDHQCDVKYNYICEAKY